LITLSNIVVVAEAVVVFVAGAVIAAVIYKILVKPNTKRTRAKPAEKHHAEFEKKALGHLKKNSNRKIKNFGIYQGNEGRI